MAATNHAPFMTQADAGPAPALTISVRWDRIPWEALLYLALVAVALSMRLWDLGARAYHYDETIHAFDSWRLYSGDSYIHAPWSHGPFLYELTAGGFLLFGDNNVAARVFPSLFGSALVIMPLFLRSYLGRAGALAAAAFLAFSPSLLYFSRFVRHDIFAVVFDLAVVIAFWKYLETRKSVYLYLAAIALALGFSSLETTYVSFIALVSFLVPWWARSWLPVAWSGATGRLARLKEYLRPSRLPLHGEFLLFILLLCLPLFSAAVGYTIDTIFHPSYVLVVPQTATESAGRVGAPDGSATAYTAAALISAALFFFSAVVGTLWKGKTFLFAFVGFYLVFFLLHTTFLTNMVGMGTGVWQSLGYWIRQQPVQRANQPWYYYFILLSVYEFLPFVFGVMAVIVYSARRGARFLPQLLSVLLAASAVAVVLHIASDSKVVYLALPLGGGLMFLTYLALRHGSPFEWFLVHWALITLLLYVVAGEKMPWLLTHVTLPFALLAGRFVGRMIETIRWREALRRGGVALLFAAPLLVFIGLALDAVTPWRSSPIGVWSFVGALGFTVVLLAGGAALWVRVGHANAARLAGVSLLAALAFFTVRAGAQAAYANADDPREPIVYSQVGPEVPRIIREVDERARVTGKGKDLPVLADTANAQFAPWRWYLRHYANVKYLDLTNFNGAIDEDVVLLADSNDFKLNPVRDRYGKGERVRFLEWFNPGVYSGYTAGKFFDDVGSSLSWRKAKDFFIFRKMGSDPAQQHAIAYFAAGPS